MNGLIGYTGFVGGCLRSQHEFAREFNQANISEIAGSDFETLVCAAAPGSMLEANQDAERDRARMEVIAGHLASCTAKTVVLISTIAVLKDFRAQSEDAAAYEDAIAYGRNRRWLEEQVADSSAKSLIVRLPALYGPNLKKNFLFDMLNPVPSMLKDDRMAALREAVPSGLQDVLASVYSFRDDLNFWVLDRGLLNGLTEKSALDQVVNDHGFSAINFTNPNSEFQFYNMGRLWTDIQLGIAQGLPVLHLSPEPIRAGDIYEALTGNPMPDTAARVHTEDMRTGHGQIWDKAGPYGWNRAEVIAQLSEYMTGMGLRR